MTLKERFDILIDDLRQGAYPETPEQINALEKALTNVVKSLDFIAIQITSPNSLKAFQQFAQIICEDILDGVDFEKAIVNAVCLNRIPKSEQDTSLMKAS